MRLDQAAAAIAQPGQAFRWFITVLPRLGWAAVLVALALAIGCQGQFGDDPSSAIIELTDANFQREVLESKQLVLVEFWAPWCQPCLEMTPAIEQIAREFSGRAKVGRLRVDEHQELSSTFDVQSPPAVVVFRDGQVFKRRTGKQSEQDLRDLIAGSLADHQTPAGSESQ